QSRIVAHRYDNQSRPIGRAFQVSASDANIGYLFEREFANSDWSHALRPDIGPSEPYGVQRSDASDVQDGFYLRGVYGTAGNAIILDSFQESVPYVPTVQGALRLFDVNFDFQIFSGSSISSLQVVI